VENITQILKDIDSGDNQATEKLLLLVYNELRNLAAHKLANENPGQTLQATALVHEAYIRLIGEENAKWNSRGHFFAAAAEAMRRILIDHIRRKKAIKRGGSMNKIPLDASDFIAQVPSEDLLSLDEALKKLEAEEKIIADLVKLRFFAGLTNAQAAQALNISTRTADRYWSYARAWLYKQITNNQA